MNMKPKQNGIIIFNEPHMTLQKSKEVKLQRQCWNYLAVLRVDSTGIKQGEIIRAIDVCRSTAFRGRAASSCRSLV